MSLDTWILFFLAYLIVTLSPGPNVLLVIKNSLQQGTLSAIYTVLGNLFCQLIIVALVAIGVGELLARLPNYFFAMKCVGGVYLIYLGLKSLKQAKAKDFALAGTRAERHRKSASALFREAFFVSASNPKTMIFLSAFLPQFLDANHSHTEQFVIMYLSICIIVLGVHLAYAFAVNCIGERLVTKNFEKKLSTVTGGLFISLGGGILLSSRG